MRKVNCKGDFLIGIDGFFYYGGYGYTKVWQRKNNTDLYEKVSGGAIKKAGFRYVFGSDKLRITATVGWVQQNIVIHPTFGEVRQKQLLQGL